MCLVLSFRLRRNHISCSHYVISPVGRNDKLTKFPFIRNSLVQVTDSHITVNAQFINTNKIIVIFANTTPKTNTTNTTLK